MSNIPSIGPSPWLKNMLLRRGRATIAVADVVTATPMPARDAGALLLVLTGALTTPRTVTLPRVEGADWIVKNATTGGFSVTVKGPTGTGPSIEANAVAHITDNGTDFETVGAAGPAYGHGSFDGAIELASSQCVASLAGTGASSGVSFSAGKMKVRAGTYRISLTGNFFIPEADEYEIHVRINGVSHGPSRCDVVSNAIVAAFASECIQTLAENDELDVIVTGPDSNGSLLCNVVATSL